MVAYKRAKYVLEREIRRAKTEYRRKLEQKFASGDTRAVWQGLQAITDYKQRPAALSDDPTLPDQLNHFYARFDQQNSTPERHSVDAGCSLPPPFTVEAPQVRRLLENQNPKKAAGPDGVSGACLRGCAEQLAPVFTSIFNHSLQQARVPTCFKASVIVPVPKKAKVTTLNDYRPVALTSIVMKVFEKLVLQVLQLVTDSQFDPLQFAYRANRSVDDAVSLTLHRVLEHLETAGSYARILFIDYSSAFNTIVPQRLFDKLMTMNVDPQLCRWVLDFLLNRSQVVRIKGRLSGKITLNTGTPQGCVLSPLLFTLFTNDCRSLSDSVMLVKFSDDTTAAGLVTNGDESVYRGEVDRLVEWCRENNLDLNVSKTKELVVDFRKVKSPVQPLLINNQAVEIVQSFKFLISVISDDLRWDHNTTAIRKKAQQRMYFLRQLRKFGVDPNIQIQFYRATIESVLTYSLTTWYGSTSQQERTELDRIVSTASKIIGCDLPSLDTLYQQRVLRKAKSILADSSHPANHLFQPLPSGRRYRHIKCRTQRMQNSFFPRAVQAVTPQDA